MNTRHWWEPFDPEPNSEAISGWLGGVAAVSIGCFLIFSAIELVVLNVHFDLEEQQIGELFRKPGIYSVGLEYTVQWAPLLTISSLFGTFTLAMLSLQDPGKGVVATMLSSALFVFAVWIWPFRLIVPAFVLLKAVDINGSIYLIGPLQLLSGILLVILNKPISRWIGKRIPDAKSAASSTKVESNSLNHL